MNCRIDITGRKIWNDNAHGARPASVLISLLRDGAVIDTAEATAAGGWKYTFPCHIVQTNAGHKFQYTIDETVVPAGYTKKIEGFNVINTLIQFTITGKKTWVDNNDAAGHRPASITVNLLRNGAQHGTANVPSPAAAEDTAEFKFENVPFADAQGVPFVYTVDEVPFQYYDKVIEGFNITNRVRATP